MPQPWEKPTAQPWEKPQEGPASAPPSGPPMLPRGQLVAAPKTASNWLGDVENDLREGGSRTLIGRGLGSLQGRGDKGYSGLQAGVSPGVAEFMGSPELGMTHAAKGFAEIGEGHPLTGQKDVGLGALQASTIPTSFVAPEAGSTALEAIPSAERAGSVLQDIRSAARDVSAYPQNAWPEIERFKELAGRGGASSKPITQINRRLGEMVRNPNATGFNFPEARDFYSNISSQSAEDISRLNPTMRRQMGAVRRGMHQDLTNAASTIGRGEEYANAVKEYAQAMKLQDLVKKAATWGIPLAVGGGLADKLLRNLVSSR